MDVFTDNSKHCCGCQDQQHHLGHLLEIQILGPRPMLTESAAEVGHAISLGKSSRNLDAAEILSTSDLGHAAVVIPTLNLWPQVRDWGLAGPHP